MKIRTSYKVTVTTLAAVIITLLAGCTTATKTTYVPVPVRTYVPVYQNYSPAPAGYQLVSRNERGDIYSDGFGHLIFVYSDGSVAHCAYNQDTGEFATKFNDGAIVTGNIRNGAIYGVTY
jgi:hypothetical protein